jgi:hypothetical protein
MMDRSAGTGVVKKPGIGPVLRRRLGDQVRRQIKIQFIRSHRRIVSAFHPGHQSMWLLDNIRHKRTRFTSIGLIA